MRKYAQIAINKYQQIDDRTILYSADFSQHSFQQVKIHSRSTGFTVKIKILPVVNDGQLEFKLPDSFAKTPLRYDRCNVLLVDQDKRKYSICYEKAATLPLWKRYIYQQRLAPASILCSALYFSLKNELSLVIQNDAYIDNSKRHFQYQHKILAIKYAFGKITTDIIITFFEQDQFHLTGAYLRLIGSEFLDQRPGVIKKITPLQENTYQLTIVFARKNLKALKKPAYQLYLAVENTTGEKISLLINQSSQQLYEKLQRKTFPVSLNLEKHQLFLLSLNSNGLIRSEVKDSRHYTNKITFSKYLIALLLTKLKLNIAKQPTLIIYEKECQTAQDNGFSFYQHLYALPSETLSYNYCYVIHKHSSHLPLLTDYMDHVVHQYSIKFFLLMLLNNSFLVGSEVRSHISGFGSTIGYLFKIKILKKTVFLQHGVIAAKKVSFFTKGSDGECDLFCVSSEKERDIVMSNLNYPANEVVVTGLTRWDNLAMDKTKKEILYMPTWRTWLEKIDIDEFTRSDYYQQCMAVLKDPRLHALLKKNKVKLIFCAHPKFANFFTNKQFNDNFIQITTHKQTMVNQLIMKCAMIITDYSSILWDFCYCQKPAILYQFDQKKYLSKTGSYVDFDTLEVGDVVLQMDDLVDTIAYYIEHEFKMKDLHYKNSQQWLTDQNLNNCQQVQLAIEHHLENLVVPRTFRSYAQISAYYETLFNMNKKYSDEHIIR